MKVRHFGFLHTSCAISPPHPVPHDLAGLPHPFHANSACTPASASRLLPNLWRTDATRHAPLDLQPGFCRYQLRGATWTQSSLFGRGSKPQRHPCGLCTPSSGRGLCMTGSKPTTETLKRCRFPLLTPTRRCRLMG